MMPDAPRPNGNGLSLSAWGATLRASGRDVVLLVVLLSGFVALGTIMFRGFDGLAMDRRERTAEHLAIVTAQSELACMLAVPAEPREGRLEAAMDPRGACHYVTTVYRFPGKRL